MKRRNVVKSGMLGALGLSVLPASVSAAEWNSQKLKGNVKHSVSYWCYEYLGLEGLCKVAKEIGLYGIDLVGPEGWDTLKKYDLVSTMCNGAEINLVQGWNNKKYHKTLIENYTRHIDLVSQAGYKNLICFSGNRDGMSEEEGIENCVEGLQKIMPRAEDKGVTIQMELFNSKIDHPDYMCDSTRWGIELCKALGSPNFKLLYDIYHMQIMEGDVIRTIKNNHQYFGHYHTAGVPGRHEIDDSQELYYPAILRAIVKTGFKGVVAQEFIPANEDKIDSLRDSILRCDV